MPSGSLVHKSMGMKAASRNPFYFLLLITSFAFALTALAHAVVPWEQQPAWLQNHGWRILLVEVAGVIVLGLLSMALDRIRDLRKPAGSATISDEERVRGRSRHG